MLLISSCEKEIEISPKVLVFKDGIKDEFIIWQLNKTKSKSYPQFPSFEKKAKLKIRNKNKVIKNIYFFQTNDDYYWLQLKPNKNQYKESNVLPFQLEKIVGII